MREDNWMRGELIQSSKIKAISWVVGRGIGPQLMGGICLGVTMHRGEAKGKDPLVLPGLMGIQLCCNWPIPPEAAQQCRLRCTFLFRTIPASVTHGVPDHWVVPRPSSPRLDRLPYDYLMPTSFFPQPYQILAVCKV